VIGDLSPAPRAASRSRAMRCRCSYRSLSAGHCHRNIAFSELVMPAAEQSCSRVACELIGIYGTGKRDPTFPPVIVR
jgi:hypothetical protein